MHLFLRMSESGLIECARVYINVNKLFIFKCCYCYMKFNNWQPLVRHYLKCHNDLHQKSQKSHEYLKEEEEEEEEQDAGQSAKMPEPELVLIAGESGNDSELEIENDCEANLTTDDSDDNASGIFHIRESSRVFYNLGKTQKHIMLDFIDIIREHPCYWDPSDANYNIRDKRVESALQISVELKERWHINISEQTARASVLHLCRWFEREYMRWLSQPNRMCLYPDYYGKLYEFLPRDHLKVVPCDLCQRQFKSDERLLAHKHKMHNGTVPYRCRYCARSFAFRSALSQHENRHTKAHVYACERCDYSCSAKTDFQMHQTTHTNVRAYTCEVCGAAYKSNTSLNVHRRSHEPPSIECKVCGKMFRENYRLKRHMFVHAARKERTTGVQIYKCPKCKKFLSRSATLQKHLRDQHGLDVQEAALPATQEEHSDSADDCKEEVHEQEGLNECPQSDEEEVQNIQVFSCPPCNLDFLCPLAFEKHRTLYHSA